MGLLFWKGGVMTDVYIGAETYIGLTIVAVMAMGLFLSFVLGRIFDKETKAQQERFEEVDRFHVHN